MSKTKLLLSGLFMASVVGLPFTGCSMDTTPQTTSPANATPANVASASPASQQVAAPAFAPSAGNYSGPQSVTISTTTNGATIRYTTDGSTPTQTVGERYSAPITVSASETIKAFAYASGAPDSTVTTAAYAIAGTVAAPVFSPLAGTYPTDQSVTISCTTPDAAIHYTMDGSTPTAASATYTAPITVAGNGMTETIKAIATDAGMTASSVATGVYGISYQVSPPAFSPDAGTYSGDQSVTISCATPDAVIHYTTDGSAPTAFSATYLGAIPVAGNKANVTIKAFATGNGMSDSPVASAAYTINYSQVSTPNFSPAAATYSTDQSVIITCATPGAAIHYTTDTTPPSASSPLYTAPISVAKNGSTANIKAYAVKAGMSDSGIGSASYVIGYPQVATPTFSPAGGVYSTDQTLRISCATPGAVIHYTTDGTTPTGSSASYTTPIALAGNGTSQTFRAMATKTEMIDSKEGGAAYRIYDKWQAFGAEGSGINQLKYPGGLAVDSSGRLYVADSGNSRIVRVNDIGGKGWMALGVQGSGANQLNHPTEVALDAGGHIYIADSRNNRIVRVDDMGGAGWISFGSLGNGNNQFNIPTGVAIDAAGHVLVADSGNSRIVRVDDMSGRGWTAFGSLGSATNQLKNPVAVAVDARGLVYVADYGNYRIVRVDDMLGTGWTVLGASGPSGHGGTGQFSYPAGITVEAGGHAFVADMSNNRIVSIDDMKGTNWIAFGSPGSGVNQLSGPSAVALDALGNIYVADQYNCRIVRFIMP
jgi:sugar lactone lactonase YvrE